MGLISYFKVADLYLFFVCVRECAVLWLKRHNYNYITFKTNKTKKYFFFYEVKRVRPFSVFFFFFL